jgi:hypothetical protein
MLVLGTWVAQAQDSGCGEILRDGVFDVSNATSDASAAAAFVNWYSKSSRKSSGKGTSVAGQYGGFGASGSQTSQETISEAAAAYQAGDSSQVSKLASFAKNASAVLADAWSKCMNNFGLHVTSRTTSDPNAFYLVFRFNPSNPVDHPQAIVKSLQSSSPVLKCDKVPAAGLSVSAAAIPVLCSRTKNVSVSISFIATDAIAEGTQPIFDFPAVVPIVPLKPITFGAINANQYSAGENVSQTPARFFVFPIDKDKSTRLYVPSGGAPDNVEEAQLWLSYAASTDTKIRVAVEPNESDAQTVNPEHEVAIKATGGTDENQRKKIQREIILGSFPVHEGVNYIVIATDGGNVLPHLNGFWFSYFQK